MISLLDRNNHRINSILDEYKEGSKLTVLEGKRRVLPETAFPSLEIDPSSASNQWATTRSQRPRFTFECTVTAKTDKENYAVEYISTITTAIVEIMTSPENLQLQVLNESRWDVNDGLVDTYILDSLVEDVRYRSVNAGTVRIAEFSWFATIHEPYPGSKWVLNDATLPTVIRPTVISL